MSNAKRNDIVLQCNSKLGTIRTKKVKYLLLFYQDFLSPHPFISSHLTLFHPLSHPITFFPQSTAAVTTPSCCPCCIVLPAMPLTLPCLPPTMLTTFPRHWTSHHQISVNRLAVVGFVFGFV